MQYREYGDTGKMVSALGFGAMRLPDDDDAAVEVMQRFLDLGGNLIDTAVAYGGGRSEQMVGRAVEGRRDEVFISTKNHTTVQATRDESLTDVAGVFRQRLEESFENLGVDRIDFYHIHDFSWDQYTEYFRDQEPFETCQEALEDGRIDHLCFSSHDSTENIIRLINEDIFDGVLVQYNLLDRPGSRGATGGTDNAPAIDAAADNGMGVLIMGPLAGGRLLMGQGSGLEEALPEESTGLADLGLRFVLAKSGVSSALSGMNEISQVEENAASASREEPLSDAELEAINEVIERNERLAELYCTGCEYCLPCPQGVEIPKVFEAMNYHRVWGLTEQAKELYAKLGEGDASACVECGLCLDKCPQDLPIIEQLKESHAALGE